MPEASHMTLMPCGRRDYCGKRDCPHTLECMGIQAARARRAEAQEKPPRATAAPGGRETGKPREKRPLAEPSDTVYLYDGTLPGLYCCVHESVYSREIPAAVWGPEAAQPTLFAQKLVETDLDKAQKVRASVPKKISPRALELVEAVFLTCMEDKEAAILRFLLLGYRQGSQTPWMLGHPEVAPLLDAEKHLGGEAHLLKGFVRFSDYDGVLAATITPKNFVLPFLAEHFVTRYTEEDFLIFDRTHKAALIYQNRQCQIVPMEDIQFPQASETEENYRALWRQFYKTVAIEARTNPKCRRTHMPKRYWENMTEMREFL